MYQLNKSAFQIAPAELQQILCVLNHAINNHRKWFNNLHTSILCNQPFAEDILHESAHTQCEFGKWYYGDSSNPVKSFKEYGELESVHHFMHDNARQLAMLSQQDEPISVDVYQTFLDNQRCLIDLLTDLRDILIEHQYCFDALTGAVNRKSISLLLEQSFHNMRRYNQTYSVAMVDVDYFKKINDEYGHLIGDQVLKHISLFFTKNLRRTDCIGRYGGEEFLIMLPETNIDTAYEVLETARKNLANAGIMVDDKSLHVTFSAGISQMLEEDDDAWVAVKRADAALYEAKRTGRDRIKIID